MAAELTRCQLSGWNTDSSAHGVSVYSEPNETSKVLGMLPPHVVNEDCHFGVEFQILGSRDGWLLIDHAMDDPERSELPTRETYAGKGWVRASQV